MQRRKSIDLCVGVAVLALAPLQALAQDGYATLNGGTAGGAGGEVVRASTGAQIHEALCNRPRSDSPVLIHVEGTIDHGNTRGVSGAGCNSGDGDDRIELKDVSNISIIGTGTGAVFDQLGIHVRGSSNIILQNLHIRNVKKSGSPTSNGGDAIGMESDVQNVWVDHCTLEASGGESEGFDGLFDLKASTRYVTLSYSILRNSGRGGLVGSGDSDDANGPVTYHHNVFDNLDSRVPLLRHATAHAYNNHYNGINKSGMNPRIGGEIKAENNFFENAKDPIGTFYTNDMGYWDVSGNVFAATVSWSDDGDDNHPAGPDPVSTTSISIPYDYELDDADCVPELLMNTAGANRDLKRSDGTCAMPRSGDDGSTADDGENPEQVPADAATADAGTNSPPGDDGNTDGAPGAAADETGGDPRQPVGPGMPTTGPASDLGSSTAGGGPPNPMSPVPSTAQQPAASSPTVPDSAGPGAQTGGCSTNCAVAPARTPRVPGMLAWLVGMLAVFRIVTRSRGGSPASRVRQPDGARR